MKTNEIHCGDAAKILKEFPNESVDCIITSPPYYGLRDYGTEGQIGNEKTFDEYLDKILQITAELKRVLKKTGTLWWNHGDSYGGSGMGVGTKIYKESYQHEKRPETERGNTKCLMLQAHRLAIRMIDEQGWILRNQIIWHKPNCMPASVKDRFTVDFEPILFFTKSKKYWFDQQKEALADPTRTNFTSGRRTFGKNKDRNDNDMGERSKNYSFPDGRNKRCVWKINTKPYPEAHFAVFPEELCEIPIKAGCPEFICNKCGKAREKIIETKTLERYELPKDNPNYRPSRYDKDTPYKGQGMRYAETIEKGLTDCGCNAGWKNGIVLDPFIGSGTTAIVAERLGRKWIGIELNPEYKKLAESRFNQQKLL